MKNKKKNEHIIFCKYFNKKKTGLLYPVYPGKIGKKIYNHISKDAWNLWIQKQTKIINEKKLNMFLEKDRKFLCQEMEKFLFLKKYV